ncbi:MAG: hypothetical protein V1790_01995, partial [Planctomycetota bacterium]
MRAAKNVLARRRAWLGVAVLGAVAYSLALAGGPLGRTSLNAERSGNKQSRETSVTPQRNGTTSLAKLEPLSASQTSAPFLPAGNPSRVTAGSIPATGLGVIATVYVDWRDDEGTRLRQAGKLIGPMPGPGEMGGVATGGNCNIVSCTNTSKEPVGPCPGECSFAVHCDDANPCTVDSCDFITGSAPCTGSCAHDPVPNHTAGGCDDDVFCNGLTTCEGSKCQPGSARNEDSPCIAHSYCQTPGTCNLVSLTCLTGNIGADCTVDDDCAVPGTGSCSGGVCTPGLTPLCCQAVDDLQTCSEFFAKCSDESSNAGTVCTSNAGCPKGKCERCQPSCTQNSDCADGRKCNGDETCERTCVGGPTPGIVCTIDANCNVGGSGGLCLGQCQPGLNPCGADARCAEKKCGTITPMAYCLSDADCPAGSPCVDIFTPPAVLCFLGRCCDPAQDDANSCSLNKLATCKNTANSLWYMDDDGEQLSTDPCGGYNPADATRDPFGCPKYSWGLTQHVKETPPIYPVRVGPISDSQVCVPAPGGPGGACPKKCSGLPANTICTGTGQGTCPSGQTCDFNFDPAGRLYQLGDDYKVPNSSYLELEVVRFVLDVVNLSRLSLDVYDKDGKFVEDMNVGFQTDLTVGPGIVVLIFRAPLTIPPEGWIVLRTAERFIPNSKAFWLSTTTTAGGAGTNYPNALWINGYPGLASTVNNNFLEMCVGGPKANQACVTDADCPGSTCGAAPGILAFELAGDKVAPPVGACCEPVAGECEDGVVSWVCVDQGKTYNGDGTLCASCNGGTNAGQNCRTCSNDALTFCGEDLDCPTGGNCQVDNSKCPSTEYTCSTGNTDITECNVCSNKKCTGARVCSNKKCSGLPDNTVCTGTGQGTCPLGQTCNFIPCSADATCTPTGGTCPAVVTVCTGTG